MNDAFMRGWQMAAQADQSRQRQAQTDTQSLMGRMRLNMEMMRFKQTQEKDAFEKADSIRKSMAETEQGRIYGEMASAPYDIQNEEDRARYMNAMARNFYEEAGKAGNLKEAYAIMNPKTKPDKLSKPALINGKWEYVTESGKPTGIQAPNPYKGKGSTATALAKNIELVKSIYGVDAQKAMGILKNMRSKPRQDVITSFLSKNIEFQMTRNPDRRKQIIDQTTKLVDELLGNVNLEASTPAAPAGQSRGNDWLGNAIEGIQ